MSNENSIKPKETPSHLIPTPPGLHPERIGVDQMSDDQIKSLEVQNARRYSKPEPSGIHPERIGVDQMSDDQIKSLESQNAQRYTRPEPSGIHPDRVDTNHLSDEQARMFSQMVMERRQTDIPYKKYFAELVNNPNIVDERAFEEATIRSMQSNELIQQFISSLINKISNKVNEAKFIDSNNSNEIYNIKSEIEKLFYVYERYLYKLKTNGWNFQTIGFDVVSLKIPDDVMNEMWMIQKKYNFDFLFMIPGNLGEYYGQQFERNGKMIPGATLMYDDLAGKEVNWHQVLIYRENELTPYQLFLENQAKKAGTRR